VIRGIRDLLRGRPNIRQVNEVLTMHMGPDFILANISVDFDDRISVQQVENDIAEIDRFIKQAYPQIKRIFIEAESRGNRYPHGG
jgi:divalent metal cation (Fe/Co/Zn/Cd) transporter